MVPAPMLMRVVNLVRVMEGMYNRVAGYTKCSEVAGPIDMLLNQCVWTIDALTKLDVCWRPSLIFQGIESSRINCIVQTLTMVF
jgi:hypothetical protein